MTAAAPPPHSSIPLTIHVSRGKFMVWQPEVCRALALEWRILGEWGPPRQRQQSWGGGTSASGLASSEAAEAADTDSSDGFEVSSLPMYLMPAQVLFLLHHEPTAKLLRIVDASTLAGLRAAAVTATAGPPAIAASAVSSSPSTFSSTLAISSARDRVAAFKRNADDQAREQALKRRQYQEASGVTISAADDDQEQQATESDSKRQNTSASSEAASSSTAALPSADSSAAAPADVALPLPANSSYQLAMRTFPPPPDAEHSMHTGHPLAIALPLLFPLESAPLIVSTRLNQLELRTVLTHQARPAGVHSWAEMQRLVYENACEALGLRLHDATCPAAAAGSSSRPWSPASPFAASSAWARFLNLYGAFRHLWSLGYLVLPGAHFGADLMAYEDLPSRVHSSFLVKLLADGGAEADAGAGAGGDPSQQLDQQPTDGDGCFSISMLSNLARMASSINKAVLLVQACTQPQAETQNDQSVAAPSATSAGDVAPVSAPAARPCSCPCVSAFAGGVRRIHSVRMQCHTFHWNLTPSLAHAPFANDHLVRTQVQA